MTTVAQLSLSDAVTYSLTGFTVVLSTLALLWLLTLIMGKLVKLAGLDKVQAPATPKSSSVSIPPETIAVVTAAVSFATGGNAAIKDIRKLN